LKNASKLAEPLRINGSGNYDLADYSKHSEIAISEVLLLGSSMEDDLNTTIKIIHKKTKQEFDRFMLKAFINPTDPTKDKIQIKEKFFDPKNYFLKVETKEVADSIHFLLYFTS